MEDVITIIKKMDAPRYLVYEDSTGRYVEIIKYVTIHGDKAVAVVEVDQYKGESHMNGYDGNRYSVLITMYPPDSVDRVSGLLNAKSNIIYDVAKKKGNSQVTSGILVPPVLTKSPFAPNVPHENTAVKTESDNPLKSPNSRGMSTRSCLLDTEPPERSEYITSSFFGRPLPSSVLSRIEKLQNRTSLAIPIKMRYNAFKTREG